MLCNDYCFYVFGFVLFCAKIIKLLLFQLSVCFLVFCFNSEYLFKNNIIEANINRKLIMNDISGCFIFYDSAIKIKTITGIKRIQLKPIWV